jgi:hypothetical protein
MERPGLQRLLGDIRQALVEVEVVYKVDRLTRSLADFAKMVELFDAYHVSFVAVTQQFNTTTSMGRLMLNLLLSFAQFERRAMRVRASAAVPSLSSVKATFALRLDVVNAASDNLNDARSIDIAFEKGEHRRLRAVVVNQIGYRHMSLWDRTADSLVPIMGENREVVYKHLANQFTALKRFGNDDDGLRSSIRHCELRGRSQRWELQ